MKSLKVTFTAYYENANANMKSTFLTTLYGTDTLKSEGVAVEFTTSLIEMPDAINIPAIAITALFSEHPFPWMCGDVVPSAYLLETGTAKRHSYGVYKS